MKTWWPFFALLLSSLLFAGCKTEDAAAGTYRVEQENSFFGQGAEKFELDLKEDHSFTFAAGNFLMGKGTWSSDGDQVKLDWTEGALNNDDKAGVEFKLEGNKLIPLNHEGKPIDQWRFIQK